MSRGGFSRDGLRWEAGGGISSGSSAGLTDLLDNMRSNREKQAYQEAIHRFGRRGILVSVPLAVIGLFMLLRSGLSAGTTSRAMHCYFLLDRTGSMASMGDAVKKGFNDFVQQQRAQPGSMYMTLAQFNSENPFELRFTSTDVRTVPPLHVFEPRGTTPLYDALHALIGHALEAERHQSEREVVIAVFSDGQENASRHHKREDVFRLIERQRRLGWTFVFLGANQDAFAASRSLSMSKGATSNYVPDSRGMMHAWSDLSGSMRRARSSMHTGHARTATERANFLKGFDSAEKDFEARGSTATPEQQRQQQQQQRAGAGGAKGRGLGHVGKGRGGGRRRARQEHAASRAARAAATAA